MTNKVQTTWVVMHTRSRQGYEARRAITGGTMILLCDDVIAAPDLDAVRRDLRSKYPRGIKPDTRFPFEDPDIVEAWAA